MSQKSHYALSYRITHSPALSDVRKFQHEHALARNLPVMAMLGILGLVGIAAEHSQSQDPATTIASSVDSAHEICGDAFQVDGSKYSAFSVAVNKLAFSPLFLSGVKQGIIDRSKVSAETYDTALTAEVNNAASQLGLPYSQQIDSHTVYNVPAFCLEQGPNGMLNVMFPPKPGK